MIRKSISNRLYIVRAACMKTNRSFLVSRIGSSFIALNKNRDSEALRSCVLDPEALMKDSTVIKDSRTTKAVLATLSDGTKVFIKRYNNKGLKYTLKYMFRKARAFRAWRSAWALEACGVPTPKNFAAVSFRRFGIIKSAYLITEQLENTVSTREFYKTIQSNEQLCVQYIDDIVRMIAILHENGIIHGDLKLSNTYIQKNKEEQYNFGLWDLDGTKFSKEGISIASRRSELARIIASYIEMGMRVGVEHNQEDIENMFLGRYSLHTSITLKGEAISALIKKYVTKSHKRILKTTGIS